MSRQTRPLTGKPSWPLILLAGREKAGKTYAAVEAAASDLIGRTLLIVVGEDIPEEYRNIPGVGDRAEVVPHDGTYRDILAAVTWATEQPTVDGKPNHIVLDSASRVWALLSDAAQETANERAKRKGRKVGDAGADIGRDLWNTATQRWYHILDELRRHQGPVTITARLDEISGTDANGQPTRDKEWKVQGQKNLRFEVGVLVELRAFGEAWLTGVKSLRFRPTPNEYVRLPEDWTVDGLWRQLGLADAANVGAREHADVRPQGEVAERDALLVAVKAAAEKAGVSLQQIADDWAQSHDGQHIAETTDLGGLELLRDDLLSRPTREDDAA